MNGSTGGAGIYLADSDGAEIDHTTIVQGQNGLMLARSSGAKVWNNTFSFLSGIGIGLYRASANTIMHNRIDWCVRGYSHTFYNRGQDSAGILIYEQSNHNVVAFNSVTHDGDGLFLWAGQSTMDTGQGGANDNVVFDNDFSFAPTNGIEATFSRNVLYGNRVEECWHGLWGGYSFDSVDRREPLRQQRRSDRHRARSGQPHHREHLRRGRDRRFTCGRTRRRIPTGSIQATRHAKPRLRHLGQHFPRQFGGTEDCRNAKRAYPHQRLREGGYDRRRWPAIPATSASATRSPCLSARVPTLDVTLPKPLPGGNGRQDTRCRTPRA